MADKEYFLGIAHYIGSKTGLSPNLIYAQMAHESGNFTSPLAKHNFNLSGLTQTKPNGEENRQPDGRNYYKKYNSYKEWADDFADNWLPRYKNVGLYEAKSTGEWAAALKRGKYFTDDEGRYAERMAAHLPKTDLNSSGSNFLASVLGETPKPTVPTFEPTPTPWTTELSDKFQNSLFNSTFVGGVRTLLTKAKYRADDNYEFSPADVEHVKKALPGDTVAQRFVLMNANSESHLVALTQMKKVDRERAERVDKYAVNLLSAGTVLGDVLGAVLDPTKLIPLGSNAVILKTLGRLGSSTAAKLSLSKIAKAGDIAAQTALINTVERKGAEVFSGYEQNYMASALIGGLAGGGKSFLGDALKARALRGDKGAQKVYTALHAAEDSAIHQAADIPIPGAVPRNTKGTVKTLHNLEGLSHPMTGTLQKFVDAEKVFVVSKADMKSLAKQWGVDIEENAAAFYKADEGYALLVKENLDPNIQLNDLLAHEIGVHAGLRRNLEDDTYNRLKTTVEKNAANPPDDAWRDAVRATHRGGWEEVLGHYIERNGLDSTLTEQLTGDINKSLRGVGVTRNLTNAEIKEFVRRSLQAQLEEAQGYRVTEDGNAVMGGLKYSNTNAFNPHIMDNFFDIDPTSATQAGFYKPLRGLTKSAEAGRFFGTIYGILANSKSPIARKVAAALFHDARMGKFESALAMPVEKMKEALRNRWHGYVGDFMDIRSEYLFGTGAERLGNVKNALHIAGETMKFNNQVRECYNATFANNTAGLAKQTWDPLVMKAAQKIKDLKEAMIADAKRSSEMFGTPNAKNLLEKDWKAWDDELWRVVDEDNLVRFYHKFPTVAKAMEFLEDYAKRFVKRDIMEAKLLQKKVKEWEEAVAKLPKEGAQKPPEPDKVTPEELQAYINEEAKGWAYGVVDRDHSNLEHVNSKGFNEGSLSFMHERLPLDTTGKLETPWGEDFSFDTHLRDDNLDRIMLKTINRMAGEAALMNRFQSAKELEDIRALIKSQLEHAASNPGGISKAEMDRELQAFDDGIAFIRGVRGKDEASGVFDATARALQNLSYAENGANMGFNQIGEIAGAVAYTGMRALRHILPQYFGDILDPNNHKALIKEAERAVFGENLQNRIWSNTSTLQSRVFKQALEMNSTLAKVGDTANTAVNYASRIVSTVSQLPNLTERMMRGARRDTIADILGWAQGETFSAIRNPFSAKKLQAAGIDDSSVPALKADVKKYFLERNGDMEGWMKESPETFWKFRNLVDNQAMRAIQQDTIGNRNVLKDLNFFTRMMFQFKDFTLKAVNGQTLRALTHREADDGLATFYSMATNAGVYAGLTYAAGYARYASSDSKRDKFIEDRISLERLGQAALVRGVMTGSLLSFGQDAYEIWTGEPTFRTTVSNDRYTRRGPERDGSDRIGEFITQFPAVRAGANIYNLGDQAYRKAIQDEQTTQRDLKELSRIMPLQNWYPMVYIINQLVEDTGLPEKRKK